MWPRWNTSSRGGSNAAADSVVTVTVTATAKKQKTPSLKDIQSLLLLQEQEGAAAAPPKRSSPSIFHRVRVASTAVRTWKSAAAAASSSNRNRNSIVLYYTSLRVVRKTFEDCRAVRSILRGLRVAIDERDLSMDSTFLDELQGRKGKEHLSLPRLFVGGRYVGGADEVQMLHETGELKKIIEGTPLVGPGGTCEGCGGFRFVLCGSCSGSHKYFHSEKGAFLTCTACNENGLLRCPQC